MLSQILVINVTITAIFKLLMSFHYSILILKDMIGNIFSGFLANLFFAIFLIGIGWLIYYATERRKLLEFFNIIETRRLVIYLSHLRIVPGGSIGIDNISRAYSGLAVVHNEQLQATKFKERFNYLIPSLSDSPSFLSKIVFADISVSIIPSPLLASEIESSSSIISFGSPGYNLVSEEIEKNHNSIVRFVDNNNAIQVQNVPVMVNSSNGFIQRIVTNSTACKRNLFYVAGLSENGTIGAANYLIKNWKSLSKRYKKDESFIIVLTIPSDNLDNYTIALERKIENR